MSALFVSTFAIETPQVAVLALSIICSVQTVIVVPEIVNTTVPISDEVFFAYIAINLFVSIWHTSYI